MKVVGANRNIRRETSETPVFGNAIAVFDLPVERIQDSIATAKTQTPRNVKAIATRGKNIEPPQVRILSAGLSLPH